MRVALSEYALEDPEELKEQGGPEEEGLKNAWDADWKRVYRDRSDRGTGARKRCLTSGISGERSESAACRG